MSTATVSGEHRFNIKVGLTLIAFSVLIYGLCHQYSVALLMEEQQLHKLPVTAQEIFSKKYFKEGAFNYAVSYLSFALFITGIGFLIDRLNKRMQGMS